MSKYRTIREVGIRAVEVMRSWGWGNVASSMLSTGAKTLEGEDWTADVFSRQWDKFAKRVLRPYSPEYFRVFEVQPRTGRIHVHFVHKVDGIAEGCTYGFDGKGKGWIVKGPKLKEAIAVVDRCREYSFGWNSTEPLRELVESNAEDLAHYLIGYLLKTKFVRSSDILSGRRLYDFSRACGKKDRFAKAYDKLNAWKDEALAHWCAVRGWPRDRVDEAMLQLYPGYRRWHAWQLFLRDHVIPCYRHEQL